MKRRILRAILFSTVLAIVLLGTPLAIAIQNRYRDETALELQREITLASAQVSSSTLGEHNSLKLHPSEASLSIGLYSGSKKIAGTGPAEGGPEVAQAARGQSVNKQIGKEVVVAVGVTTEDGQHVAIRAAESADLSQDQTERAWLGLAALALGALGAAAFAGRALANRLAQPVVELRDAAVALGDGDFTSRAASSGIPELDQAADALALTAERIDDLIERERRFTADASHQLRTPLTSLRLAIETEMENPRPDPAAFFSSALAEVDRLEGTIASLLALARDVARDRGPLDCGSLITAAGDRYSGRLAGSNRALKVEKQEDLPLVKASQAAISHALDVLVNNAVDHGSGAVTIRAKAVLGGGVAIEVGDEGKGIYLSDEQLFKRRSSGSSDKGHGIGLALARSLVQGEGGRLLLTRSGPRPVFEILLPPSSG